MITKQELIDAQVDARDLEKIINDAPGIQVQTRLGRYVWTLSTIEQRSLLKINEWQNAINTIVVNDGVPALAVSNANGKTQQEINDFGGAEWWNKPGGYKLGATVKLENGDIVKSTTPNNIINPNVDMTGWFNPKQYQDWINSQCPTVLQLNSSIKGDGVNNDSVGLQALATSVDLGLKPYMFFPFYNNSYKLNSTVVIQEPMMLWGDAVPTYNRGDGKQGKVLLNTLIGFNLGNGRTTGAVLDINNKLSKNPADQWTVKNIAFLPKDTGTQNNTQVAILHDSKTNGPDRGFIMREVSGRNLKHVLHIKDNNIQTCLATLVVEGCCLSINALPIYAEGNCWSSRIVGNQIEQNVDGAIHGVFHGGLTIHDNMIEGNKNSIYIKDHPQDRNGCYLSLQNNYFELNSGDYLVKMDSFNGNSIYSARNYVTGYLSDDGITPNIGLNRPVDHYLLTNNYTSINILDRLSVSFYGLSSCSADNNLKRFLIYSGYSSLTRVMSKLEDAVLNAENSASLTTIANKINTDVGLLYEVRKSSAYTAIPLIVQANDVIQMSFSYYTNDPAVNPTNITVVEQGTGGAQLVSAAGFNPISAVGKIQTANYIFTVQANATGGRAFMFKLDTNDITKTLSIVGASAKKIGTYNPSAINPVDNRFVVSKSKPPFFKVSDGLTYSVVLAETIVPTSGSIVKTYTVSGATNSNRVEAVLSSYLADLSVIARVSAVDTVQVSIKNNGTTSITIPNTTELSYTIY